jgi:hypothetical protein
MTRSTLISFIHSRLQSLVAEFAGEGQPDSYSLKRLEELYRVLAVHNALDAQEG